MRYAALRAGLEAECAVIRPGIESGHVFRTAVEAVEAAGLQPFLRHHVGHSIGLAVYEHPVMTSGNSHRLQAGATFCLETPYYEPGWGGMMVEDTGVVVESGFELLTTICRKLYVIPS